MAYNHQSHMSATFVPGGLDDFYMPQVSPPLVQPEPQRINPEMSNQISVGINNLDLNSGGDIPHLSPFPRLNNPPPNVPPSDDDLEVRLENARLPVLNSNDPEMQLAWAADAIIYCGVCADEAERHAAAKPQHARSTTPRIEHQLKVDSMNIVTFLADQSHPRAEFLRGTWLERGRFGQREDKKEAFRCYSRAADKGYARAEYRIGMLYESYNDPIKALRHYHRGVDAGDAASCYRLGMMTLRGQHGQPQDFSKAIALIQQSAEGADENAPHGAYVYGMLLARQLPQIEVPEGMLPYDERLAKENIEKAAYMKFAKAQAKMGSAYELGSLGCEFNPALSVHYNALAAKQGEAEADMALSKWFLVGSEGLFPKNEDLAFTYAERAAQASLATAEFAMGYFNEIGMHVPVDLDKAIDWYQKAAKHGNVDAKGRIDGLEKKQVLSRKDHENVAIGRIKSMHGSMRGDRSGRSRQQQQPSLSSVTEIPAYAPSTSYTPSNSNEYAAVQAPARGTTPYPIDDRLPAVNVRPASVVPYPMDDGPPDLRRSSGPTPIGGFFSPPPAQQSRPLAALNPPLDRPSSAFMVNPEIRISSMQPVQQYPPSDRNRYPISHLAPGPLRPQPTQPYDQRLSSAPPGPGGPFGALHPNDPRARPAMGNRVVSGPANMQNRHSTGGPPPPGPGHSPHQAPVPAPAPAPAIQPDIGFVAPHMDRPQTVDPTWREKGDKRRKSKEVQQPVQQQKPLPNPGRQTSSAIPEQSKVHKKPVPTETQPTKPAAPRLPGKGPQTFDEMGVPAHEKEKDCVIM